jgi:hypothetical protein
MDNLHSILGHIISVDETVKIDGLRHTHCEELAKLVDMALDDMPDPSLEMELTHFKLKLISGADMNIAFNELTEISIVNISMYIYPIPDDTGLF